MATANRTVAGYVVKAFSYYILMKGIYSAQKEYYLLIDSGI